MHCYFDCNNMLASIYLSLHYDTATVCCKHDNEIKPKIPAESEVKEVYIN